MNEWHSCSGVEGGASVHIRISTHAAFLTQWVKWFKDTILSGSFQLKAKKTKKQQPWTVFVLVLCLLSSWAITFLRWATAEHCHSFSTYLRPLQNHNLWKTIFVTFTCKQYFLTHTVDAPIQNASKSSQKQFNSNLNIKVTKSHNKLFDYILFAL